MLVASLQNITTRYGGQNVQRGVSFGINAVEKLRPIGANGSGKTTMLSDYGRDVKFEPAASGGARFLIVLKKAE